MPDNFDPFALGGWQSDGDVEILALFRRWVEESRIADAAVERDSAWDAALEHRDRIEERIASCRCGPVGLAIKTFILLRSEYSNGAPSLAQIRCEPLFKADCPSWDIALMASTLRDAAALVPAIGECAAAVVHEDAALIDAEMGVAWCRGRLASECHTASRRWIESKLAALLDRIERTEAKTPSGEAIKARYAAS